MKRLPETLIFSRLAAGATLLACSLLPVGHFGLLAVVLVSVGLLTDIFDGIAARRLGVSTERLRRMDSAVDQAFWLMALASAIVRCPPFFQAHLLKMGLLIGVEALTYVISYARFKKEVATHAISSKIWTLVLFATLIEILTTCHSPVLFEICFWTGLVTRFEIILIVLTLKVWTNDVPSFYHAIQLRKGKPIRRNKIFNG